MADMTRRSFLKGIFAALTVAGTPAIARAAMGKCQLPPHSVTETEKLTQMYMPLCAHLEGDMPFAYKDKNHPTIGCGVHFKNFTALNDLAAIKISPKKGCKLSLNKTYLSRIVSADWKNPKTKLLFPEVESVETVKLKDCSGKLPKSSMKKWDKALFWIPKTTREKSNHCAANFCVEKAKELHPNLFHLPPSLRLVVVDLIYNLGDAKYKKKYPKFQEAVRRIDLMTAQKECGTQNLRRDTVKKLLIESAILAAHNSKLPEETIKKLHRKTIKSDDHLSPLREAALWQEIDRCTSANCTWEKTKVALAQKTIQKTGFSKRS